MNYSVSTTSSGGLVYSSYGYANAVTITASHSIIANDGVALYAKGWFGTANQWSFTNSAWILGDTGIKIGGTAMSAGTVSNTSIINKSGGTIAGSTFGVFVTGSGNISNASGGTISASAGLATATTVYFSGAGTVTNAGTMASTGTPSTGVSLKVGGAVTNSGEITATGTAISAGGAATVTNSGTISAASGIVLTTGDNTVTDSGTIIGTGGTAVSFAGTGTNRLALSPGYGMTGAAVGAVSGTNTLELQSAAGTGTVTGLGVHITNFQTLAFDSGAHWLVSGSASANHLGAVTMTGFASGDTIDLTGFVAVKDSFAGNVLTLTDAANNQTTLKVSGAFQSDSFRLSSDGNGGTFLVLCFADGTKIATDMGDVAIEALREGDRVFRPLSGDYAPVRWIGRRAVDLTRHDAPDRVRPIRIRAHAFGPDLPRRDLLVSPDHAIYVDGVLIPAKLLVNGGSIAIARDRRAVTYFHLELDSHDIVLAEGLPAETYLDTGNRAMFENGGEPMRLHPDFEAAQQRRETESRVPFTADPDRVEPVWRALAARAGETGWPLPEAPALMDDPEVSLSIGGRRIDPLSVADGRYTFAVPRIAGPVHLISRAARAGVSRPWVDDPRSLGVLVRRLTLRARSEAREIALDDPMLDDGWWQVEWHAGTPCRWTDGAAMLPNLVPGLLEIEVAGSVPYALSRLAAVRIAA